MSEQNSKIDKSPKTKNEAHNNQSQKPLLKILMLHGFRQSEAAFRERSGGLRKYLKKQAEFTFCEAPHRVPNAEAVNEDIEKGWWFSSAENTYNALEITECDDGFKETLEYINTIFQTKGPFDGIFGFSQGGCLASILSKLCVENNADYEFIRFKFTIIVAGFKSNQIQHQIFYDSNRKIDLPSMHLIGNADKVIPSDVAVSLTEYFLNPKIFYHDAGHFIPVNSESKTAFVDFLSTIVK